MAPNGKKKAGSPPSFDDVEAKRVEMVKSLSAVAEAFEAATTSVRAYLECAPHALAEPPVSAADSKKRKAVKEKKVKDPNAPKRPVTGYLAYSKDQMPKLREAHPEMPHKAIVGLITEQWAKLPDEEKKPYNDTFSAALAEWKGKTAEYNQSHENGAAPAASTETKTSAVAKPAASAAETVEEAGSDEDETASTASTDSSASSETEEEDAKPEEADGSDEEEEEEEDVPQPPAKRTKRDTAPAATPSKSQQKPKSSSGAAAAPTSSAQKPAAATPVAESASKKDKKSKKTEAAPASSEETPAKKRGRKPKAQ